jgi:hypothetical protein
VFAVEAEDLGGGLCAVRPRSDNKPNTDYASIYDNAIVKEGLDPLRKIPGIEINQVTGRHLMPNLDIVDAPYYHEIKLSPEAREHILSGPGQSIPGYAAGGLVANDYDEEQIDRMSDEIFHFKKGGDVSVQPHENEYVKAAGKLSRKAQGMAASIVPGLRPILDKAQDLPLKYYAATGDHNGEADAMRHMLLQAQLMQKYGETPAKAIGWLHENISFGQPEREQAMDEYNDVLGRQIGAKARSEQEMIDMARQYIDTKRAKSLAQDNSPDGYAEGGEVNTDLSKYGIDASQMQKLTDLSDSSQWLQKYNQANPVTTNPDLNQLASYYKEQSTTPVAPVAQRVTPTYANEIESKYAQNVGGQFADPYQNYLMKSGSSTDIDNLLNQYTAAGRTDTPDWAKAKGNMNALAPLMTKWDASGSTPVSYLDAYNRTAPTTDKAPEGYWDAMDAYNTGLSEWNPQLAVSQGKYDPVQFADYNAAAYNAMKQGVYDKNSDVYQNYVSPKQQAQQAQTALANTQYELRELQNQRQRTQEYYAALGLPNDSSSLDARLAELEARYAQLRAQDAARQANSYGPYAEGGMVTGYAQGGLVYNDAAISNLADQLLGA